MRSIYISTIFKKSTDNQFTDDSLIYQDILRYSTIIHEEDFRFTDLGNWLIRNNKKMRAFYDSTSSKRNTPYNRRLHGQRTSIENKLDDLIKLKLIYVVRPVKSEKNTLNTKLYSYSKSAQLLAWLIKVKEEEESRTTKISSELLNNIGKPQKRYKDNEQNNENRIIDKKLSDAIQHILEIIDSWYNVNNSSSILFMTNFFKKCKEKGVFSKIIFHFMTLILSNSKVSSGGDLLSLFLGLRQTLNWVLASPYLFRETIVELDKETRKLILFKLKMEIEEYYNENHHLSEESLIIEQVAVEQLQKLKIEEKQEYRYIITVPGSEWQKMRYDHMSDYSKVTLPGFCESCKSERPFQVDIFRYLDFILSAHGPYPSRTISENCNLCGTEFGTRTSVIMLPYLMAW